MRQRAADTLRILLLTGIFLMIGWCIFTLKNSEQEKSIFELQQEYAGQIQEDLSNLLEPLVGAGNIKTIAQVRLQQIDQTVVSKELTAPYKQSTTTTRYQGPALKAQHVSVLLNSTNRILERDVWTLVENALGIDFSKGDTLSIRMIPFVHIPFWSFGLARLTLIRIAGVLVLAVLLLAVVLLYLYKKSQIISRVQSPRPNESLWRKASQLSPTRLANTLNTLSPEVSAFILYRFPSTLSGQITDLLPSAYVSQVMIHMNHLENLPPQAYRNLLLQSETCLMHLVQKKYAPDSSQKVVEILNNSHQKDTVYNQMNQQDSQTTQSIHLDTLNLDDSTTWTDGDFQVLLRYLDKETAVLALQTAPLKLHQRFAENLPVDVWQEIANQCRQTPGTLAQSQQAQQKMLDIAKNLIINHLVKI